MPRTLSRPLGAHDILTVVAAVTELGMGRADAVTWLSQNGLIIKVAGRRRVIWGDVVNAARGRDLDEELREEALRRDKRAHRLRVPFPKTTAF